MAQYINREKLLKRMEGYCEANCGCKPYEDALCPSCGLGDAIYMVEEQRIVNSRNMRGRKDATVALSKMENTTRWIPVTEEPPLKVGDDGYNGYLVYANGYYEVADYTTDKFDNVPYFHVNGEYEPDVTHWMPLPEPPKEET